MDTQDPHVKKLLLRYELQPNEKETFNNPPPIEFEREELTGELVDNVLTCEMKDHYSTVGSAHQKIEDFLRAWEIDAALQHSRIIFKFVYLNAELIDGPKQITISGPNRASKTFTLTVNPAPPICNYPEPPTLFNADPDVETLWYRYELYKKQREELLPMAYFCISFVKYSFGKIDKASKSLNISNSVLEKIKDISSNRGDHKTARKITKQAALIL